MPLNAQKSLNIANNYGLKSGINLEAGLNDMPANIFMKLRDQLDTNPADKDWRALAGAVENEYCIKPAVLERFSPAISGQSASAKLLTLLSSQGMTVAELIKYLNHLRIDTFPLGLSPYEDIEIVKCPSKVVEVHEGGALMLEVEATGQPYPRYQWFFCQNGQDDFIKLQGRVENSLRYDSVTNDDAGNYSCRIHNCGDPKKTKFTSKILVSVSPNLHPLDTGLKVPNIDTVIHSYLGLGSDLESSQSRMMLDFAGGLNQRSSSVSYSLILGHPRDVTLGMNEPFVLSVETCGDPPIAYQWYRNGLPLEGRFTSKLEVSQATALDFGRYHCVVSTGYKTEQSNTACVTEKLLIPDRNVEILVVSQPKSVSVKFGGCALFSCEVKCCEPLSFQWFKDGMPLQGETTSEIKFMNIQNRSVAGLYQCEISVNSLSRAIPRRLTSAAVLALEIPSVKDSVEYNPSDKVALLIGNSDYKSETALNATMKDVQVLTESFKALDFKVVSLINLTKPEIENAVLHFCDLVDKNVYVVFYFCGHGFEEYGLSYFVPTDAPAAYTAQECVCAQTIQENIQKKHPPFIFMIIDICRQGGKVKSNSVPPNLKLTIKGNTVFCYATSVGLAAYENKNGGLLVNHLSPLLPKKIGIDALISNLKEEFHRVPKHSDLQIPQLVSNLQEPRRSLTDKISHKGQTEAFQMRTITWMNARVKPPKQEMLFAEVGVIIELDFQAEFSNVLHTFVTVTNPGRTDSCFGKITNFSPPISQHGKTKEYKQESRVVTNTSLQDIQKLQENLIVDVSIYFFINATQYFLTKRVNLGQPLVAKLRLWEQTPNFTPNAREGIEQGEDTDSYGAAN